jgi:hypothetical protein
MTEIAELTAAQHQRVREIMSDGTADGLHSDEITTAIHAVLDADVRDTDLLDDWIRVLTHEGLWEDLTETYLAHARLMKVADIVEGLAATRKHSDLPWLALLYHESVPMGPTVQTTPLRRARREFCMSRLASKLCAWL